MSAAAPLPGAAARARLFGMPEDAAMTRHWRLARLSAALHGGRALRMAGRLLSLDEPCPHCGDPATVEQHSADGRQSLLRCATCGAD